MSEKAVKNLPSKPKNTKKDSGYLISKVVRVILANKRQAPAKTKTRSEVSGGGRKPWRQKGTGRARAGSNRSPLWRGGGITFGPTGEQNFSLKANKKEIQKSREEAWAIKKDSVISVNLKPISKTKEASEIIKKHKITGNFLVTVDSKSKDDFLKIKKAFKNIPGSRVLAKGSENAYDILKSRSIIDFKVVSQSKSAKSDNSKKGKEKK